MTGMGCPKLIVKAPEQNGTLVLCHMGEYTEKLFRQFLLIDSVMVIKSSLCTPANMERGMNMSLAPLHNLAKFGPVVYIFKVHQLHRCTGDHHAVKLPVFQFVKALVERKQMLLRDILWTVGTGVHQLQIDLQRGIAQKPAELRFCGDLGGH